MALIMAGLMIGLLLMSIQLWLLTIALDLYLAGASRQIWLIALVSGAIFLGGLLMLRLLRRRPRVRGVTTGNAQLPHGRQMHAKEGGFMAEHRGPSTLTLT